MCFIHTHTHTHARARAHREKERGRGGVPDRGHCAAQVCAQARPRRRLYMGQSQSTRWPQRGGCEERPWPDQRISNDTLRLQLQQHASHSGAALTRREDVPVGENDF